MYVIGTTFLGLSPWRDVMCDMLCMLGEAAVRGLIDCIFKIGALMDVCWSKGCDIPTSESSHVPPITNYNFTISNNSDSLVHYKFLKQYDQIFALPKFIPMQ